MSAPVSRETDDKKKRYLRLVAEWNSQINLVAPSEIPTLEERHWKDSFQLAKYMTDGIKQVADLGSGGGFPVIPLAIAKPNIEVCAIESDKRKYAFLQVVKADLGLDNLRIFNMRMEQWQGDKMDIITARACAPLEKLIAYARPFMHTSSRCLFLKGKQWQLEVETAAKDWMWEMQVHPSITDPQAAILELWNLRQQERV